MPGIVLLAVVGIWLTSQAVVGRLAARVLSWRPDGLAGYHPSTTGLLGGEAGATKTSSGLLGGEAGATKDTGILSIDDVARVALNAGLTHDQAVTATAIAMRESGGNTGAHNPVYPDDSYGLWQINRLAWAQFPASQLETASGNAAAMLIVSSHGTNWQPWQIGGNPLARTNVDAARTAVARVTGAG